MGLEHGKRRLRASKTRTDHVIDLGDAGSFNALRPSPGDPPDGISLEESRYVGIHRIDSPTGSRVYTAYRSEQEPEILLIIWANYPFNAQIEDGGDFMLQVMHGDRSVKYLLIDNSYVRSAWMNERMVEYLSQAWIPGLVWLGLKGFCHIRASSYLGEKSFDEFSAWVTRIAAEAGRRLGRPSFLYFPIANLGGGLEEAESEHFRKRALSEAVSILRSLRDGKEGGG